MTTLTAPDLEAVEAIAPKASTLIEAFARTAAEKADQPAIRAGARDHWITWRQYAADAERAARALASLGVRRGDTVALMLRNRPEFHAVDGGALQLGAIPFSVYNTSSPQQISSPARAETSAPWPELVASTCRPPW